MKIRPVGAELFHANGRTDMAKLTVAVSNSANAPTFTAIKKPKPNNTQLQPSQLSLSVPPQHSALPPTNTHFIPIYVFSVSRNVHPIHATFTGRRIGWKTNCFLCGTNEVTSSSEQRGTSQYRASNHKNIFPFPR